MKKFKKALLPAILTGSLVFVTACSSTGSTGGDVYISTKDGNITQKEVLDYIGSAQISKAATDVAIRKVLLTKYKDKIDEKYVEQQLNEVQTQYGGKEAFEAALTKQGFTLDKYKEALKVRTAQAYMIADSKGLNEDSFKQQFEKEKIQYNLAHILISTKSDITPNGLSDEEAKAKAEEIKKKLDAGEDFAKLAKENSTDTSNAPHGGELGWSSKESSAFVKEFTDVAYSLEKGKYSNVTKTQFGYHIIKVLDTKEIKYEESKTQLVEILAQKAVAEDPTIYSQALKKLFDEYQVKGSTNDVKSYLDSMLATNQQLTNPVQSSSK